MRHEAILSLLILVAPIVDGCGEVTAQDDPGRFVGSYDDLPIDDHDLQALEQLLSDKWNHFLYQMDRYNEARDSERNDAMIAVLERVFAPSFAFHAYYADGTEFRRTQGDYSPQSWLQANDVIGSFAFAHEGSTMLVPSYDHTLTVEEPGRRVVLEGYHEHLFIGSDVRLFVGDARQMADERIVFEKIDGVWRVTDYVERVFRATEVAPASLATTP